MESLKKIQTDILAAERDFNHCISTIKEYTTKWAAIQLSFTTYQESDLSSFKAFPDLRSRLELSQLSACDSIVVEMSRQLVLFEHNLTNNRAAFTKAKKMFESKPTSDAWSFPPSTTFVPDMLHEVSELLDSSMNKLNARRLAIYKLTNEEDAIEPGSLERFINSVQ